MSWLDQVVSIPLIGLHLQPRLTLALRYAECLAPLLDEEGRDVKLLESSRGRLVAKIDSGITYDLSIENLIVRYEHPSNERRRPGRLPEFYSTEVPPYSELLSTVKDHAYRLLKALRGQDLRILRVGVVATSLLTCETQPPGISDWRTSLASHWNGQLSKANAVLLVEQGDTETHSSRCHHTLLFDEHAGEGVQVALDWQRALKAPANARSAPGVIEETVSEALVYFEEFGQGVRS